MSACCPIHGSWKAKLQFERKFGRSLSLLGFEPQADYQALVKEARGRRLFFSDASRSLLLQKATGRVPHGGGKRLATDSHDYQVLLQWIQQGAVAPSDQDITLANVAVSPSQLLLDPGMKKQLKVTASFSDGSSRDVTQQALFTSNEEEIALFASIKKKLSQVPNFYSKAKSSFF